MSSGTTGMKGRKRTNEEVKKEQDDSNPPSLNDSPAPAPSLTTGTNKKRRVTLSGSPLRIDVPTTTSQTPGGPTHPHASSTPISPVVMGLNIPHEQVVQVRSMLSVKQKQKALIEQRRGSLAGAMSPVEGTNGFGAKEDNTSTVKNGNGTNPNAAASSRRSPSSSAVTRRRQSSPPPPPPASGSSQSQAPPPPPSNSNSNSNSNTTTPIQGHSLPPPPISFSATRRAQQQKQLLLQQQQQQQQQSQISGGGGRKKQLKQPPADILISPRDDISVGIGGHGGGVNISMGAPGTGNIYRSQGLAQQRGLLGQGGRQLAMHAQSVQSAPPGQNTFFPGGRFPPPPPSSGGSNPNQGGGMAIPRLPGILNQPDTVNVRRVAGNVPPTPTRLSMQSSMMNQTTTSGGGVSASASTSAATPSGSGPNATGGGQGQQRSPPTNVPSIPISASLIPLIPPTPTTFTHGIGPTAGAGGMISRSGGKSAVPHISGHSNPNATTSTATSATTITPASGSNPSSSAVPGQNDKEAFLKPFELFYDALNDSKQLKGWLQDQLVRSGGLLRDLSSAKEASTSGGPTTNTAGEGDVDMPPAPSTSGGAVAPEHIEKLIERAVERRMEGTLSELGMLRRRIEELEGERERERDFGREREQERQIDLRGRDLGRRGSVDRSIGGRYLGQGYNAPERGHGHALMPNGVPPPPLPPQPSSSVERESQRDRETYVFPPPPPGAGHGHSQHPPSSHAHAHGQHSAQPGLQLPSISSSGVINSLNSIPPNSMNALPSMSLTPPNPSISVPSLSVGGPPPPQPPSSSLPLLGSSMPMPAGPSHSYSYPYYERERDVRDGRDGRDSREGRDGRDSRETSRLAPPNPHPTRPGMLRRLSSPGWGHGPHLSARDRERDPRDSSSSIPRERDTREVYERRMSVGGGGGASLGGPSGAPGSSLGGPGMMGETGRERERGRAHTGSPGMVHRDRDRDTREWDREREREREREYRESRERDQRERERDREWEREVRDREARERDVRDWEGPSDREREREWDSRERERNQESERERERERDREREWEREREAQREREREWEMEAQAQRERDAQRERGGEMDRQREVGLSRQSEEKEKDDDERESGRERENEREEGEEGDVSMREEEEEEDD